MTGKAGGRSGPADAVKPELASFMLLTTPERLNRPKEYCTVPAAAGSVVNLKKLAYIPSAHALACNCMCITMLVLWIKRTDLPIATS